MSDMHSNWGSEEERMYLAHFGVKGMKWGVRQKKGGWSGHIPAHEVAADLAEIAKRKDIKGVHIHTQGRVGEKERTPKQMKQAEHILRTKTIEIHNRHADIMNAFLPGFNKRYDKAFGPHGTKKQRDEYYAEYERMNQLAYTHAAQDVITKHTKGEL